MRSVPSRATHLADFETCELDDVRASDVGEIVLSLCPAEAGVRRRETTPPVVVRYAS
jgi:hypothetical protein